MNVGKNMKKLNHLLWPVGREDGVAFWKSNCQFKNNTYTETSNHDSGHLPKEIIIYAQTYKNLYTYVYKNFIHWNQNLEKSQYPPTGDYLTMLLYLHNGK